MRKGLIFILLVTHILLTAEVIWDNFYNPFGATGINVRPHMAVCADGGFAVTGYYVIEDPWGGYIDWCGYVMKISSDGELLWADPDTLSFAGWNESDTIIETSDGGLINCGDGYMIKRDSNGNRLWSQDLNIAPTTMCHSQDGNIVLSGSGPGGACLFRIIDEDGNEILNNDFFIGLYSTTSKRIIQTSDGGCALTGRITDEVPDSDIFICKTDAVGDTLWTYRKDGSGNGDVGNWIIENSDDYYLFRSMVESITENKIVGYGRVENDIALLSYSYEGENVWNSLLPIRTALGDRCLQKIDNGFILCARSMNWDIALVKTDNNGQVTAVDDEIITLNEYKLINYPNPFNPTTTISFLKKNLQEDTRIEIFNIKGQKIKTLNIEDYILNIGKVCWNGTDENNKLVSSGVYYAKLKINNETKAINLK